jgi:hypothetical protein
MFAYRLRTVTSGYATPMGLQKITRPVFQRTADALEQSAVLADEHAAWEEHKGRHEHAADERRRAEWAREKAQLARARASRR